MHTLRQPTQYLAALIVDYIPHRTSPCISVTAHFHLHSQCHEQTRPRETSYASWRILGLVVPEFGLEHLGRHGFDILLRVVLGDGGEDQQALADGGDELAVDRDGGRLDPLQHGWALLVWVWLHVGGRGLYFSWWRGNSDSKSGRDGKASAAECLASAHTHRDTHPH